jgi:hypothetical protein
MFATAHTRIFLAIVTVSMCGYTLAQSAKQFPSDALQESMNRLTEVIVHDIFSPPVSSRIYAYTSIAAYEAMEPSNKEYAGFSGNLNGLQLTKPRCTYRINFPLAGITAFFETAKAFTFSEQRIADHYDSVVLKYFSDIPQKQFEKSIAYGKNIAQQIINWSKTDNYAQTRTFERYTHVKLPGSWEPTPPDYADAVEPYWGLLRPFLLDSAAQCQPPPPTEFSTLSRSQFYEEALAVYLAGKSLNAEQKEIVLFWDDNPAVVKTQGHLTYLEKKPTPAGHWMGITGIAIDTKEATMMSAAQAYALVSIALADGFISCWHEKYMRNTIRPETFINQYIDEQWKPFLQTPPFPEYTSGHSVISHAAATVLTKLFGEFSYADSVSYYYGIKPRKFSNFMQAAGEASISRFYGGIHFMPALDNGRRQGMSIGNYILEKLVQ